MGALPDFQKTVTLEGLEALGYSKDDWFTFKRIAWLPHKERQLLGKEFANIDLEMDAKLKTMIVEWNIRDVFNKEGGVLQAINEIQNITTKMPGPLLDFINEVILQDQYSVADPFKLLNLAKETST